MSAPHPAPGPPDSVLIGGPSSALTPPLPHHPPSLPVPGCLQGPRLRRWPSWAGPAALRGPEPKPAATRPAFPLSCPSGHHLQRRPAGRGGRAKPARTPPWRLSSRIPQLTHCTCIHTTPVTHIPHTCTHTHTHPSGSVCSWRWVLCVPRLSSHVSGTMHHKGYCDVAAGPEPLGGSLCTWPGLCWGHNPCEPLQRPEPGPPSHLQDRG